MRSHIIKHDRVELTGATKAAAAARPSAKRGAQARLLSHDGVVRGVEITCACGAVTVVELTYDAAPTARPNPKG